MKIAFDTTPLHSGHKTRGIGSYTYNLLNELKKSSAIEVVEFKSIKQVHDVDLVHYPYFDLFFYTLPIKKKFSTIVTIHDVTPLIFPKHYPRGLKGLINFKLQKYALKNVDAVITDSYSSKKDIEKYLGVKSTKIFPIHLAIDSEYRVIPGQELRGTRDKYNLPDQFAIYIGNVNWNKNIVGIYKACKQVGMNLVLVGSAFEQNNQDLNHLEMSSYKEFLELSKNDSSVIKIGYVEKKELVEILNLASMLLMPSHYEGFGLPILEAQACGVPVITGNISSMPEVSTSPRLRGASAVLVDPYSVEEIAQGMKKLEDRKLKIEIIKKGFENIKRFSWEKTARETLEVYKKVAKL